MILVTGGSGVLGHALLHELANQEEPVHVVQSTAVDLRDSIATRALFEEVRPRLVYHLAAKVHGLGGNSMFPAEMFTDNVRINTNVIDSAHKCGAEKIVAVSTVATYSSALPMPFREDGIWQGPPHKSEAAYGHAKRAMLAQLEAYQSQYGLKFAYPLMTNIYGPHDRFDLIHGHVVPSLVAKFHEAAVSGGEVQVWGTGVAQRDFIYAQDSARALTMIAEGFEGAINIATGKIEPIKSVVDILAKVSGVKRVAWDPSKPDGQIERSYDIANLSSLGFAAEVSLADGLALTYQWYAENYPAVRR